MASTYVSQHGKKTMRRTPHQQAEDRRNEYLASQRNRAPVVEKPAPPPVQVVHTVETIYVEPSLDEIAAAVIIGALLS